MRKPKLTRKLADLANIHVDTDGEHLVHWWAIAPADTKTTRAFANMLLKLADRADKLNAKRKP